MTDSDIYDKAVVVDDTWRSMRPNKAFFGMTVDDFAKKIAPSGDARKEIAQLEKQMREALDRRDKADRITRRIVLRIVNGVKGDPEEGEDSELLAAMGYLPHTARSSIVSAARKNAHAAKAAAAQASEEDTEVKH